jgi:hypothetical protein
MVSLAKQERTTDMTPLLALGLFLLSQSSLAGYYAKELSVATGNWPWPSGTSVISDCYETPSQAINALPSNNNGWYVTAIDVAGNWSARYLPGTWYPVITGMYYQCSAPTLTGSSPTFAPGVSDPATTPPTNPPTTPTDAATIAALESTVATLQTTVAAQGANVTDLQSGVTTLLNAQAVPFDPVYAFAAFSFFFVAVITLWSGAKGIGLLLNALKNGGIHKH